MSAEARLASIHRALLGAGLQNLVMGGHAVRFYGIDRHTVDYDLVVTVDDPGWHDLGRTIAALPAIEAVHEGPSWRPADVRRFIIGKLGGGQDERLEFWRHNHLLAPFAELWARRAEAMYGGAIVAFLGIDDLIRSKETERDEDWRDVARLEEIADERRLGDLPIDVAALVEMRSRRGFERALALGIYDDVRLVSEAASRATHPISCAYLAPAAPTLRPDTGVEAIQEITAGPLRSVTLGSARHLALVEAVRRLYRQAAMAADRADKLRASGA